MRLKNMYFVCKQSIAVLRNIKYTESKTPNDEIYRIIHNSQEVLQTLNSLKNVDCLAPLVTGLIKLEKGAKDIVVKQYYYEDFSRKLSNLIERVQTIVDLGDSVGFDEYKNGFDIKLPPDLPFSDVVKCINDIDKVLGQCPYLKSENEKIEFSSVDVGSTWLTFLTICTGSAIILTNLAAVVDKCVTIASHITTVATQKKQMKTLDLTNELLENMIGEYKVIQNALVTKCALEIEETISPLDNEDHERMKMCLNTLSDWMSKGMEIHTSIESPQEIKDLFPSQERQQFLLKQIELLENRG